MREYLKLFETTSLNIEPQILVEEIIEDFRKKTSIRDDIQSVQTRLLESSKGYGDYRRGWEDAMQHAYSLIYDIIEDKK